VKNIIRPISGSLAKLIPVHLFPEVLTENIEKILQALILPPHEYTIHYSEMCSNRYDTVSQLLDLDCPDDFMKNYKKILSNYTPKNILEIILSIYQSYYLVEGLNTITKIGEASGIEFRHPFIDIDLINLFNQFPWKEKKRFFKRKHQVVELGKRYLPKQFFQKRKEGFGVPLKTWFGNEKGLGRYVGLLNDSKTRERGIFNVNYLDQLLTQYRKKELIDSAYERILWPIINLELWHRIFIDNNPTGYK
jgi:asparagine synthetase B (glutamine-hydrolysing)